MAEVVPWSVSNAPSLVITRTADDHSVSDRTLSLIAASVPENTRRAYDRQWRTFTAWCADNGRTSLPATSATVAEYIAHLTEDRQASPATVEQALGCIRRFHREGGYAEKLDTRPARAVLRGYRRRRADAGQSPTQAPPVTIDALRRMVDACDWGTLIGQRDRLVLVLGLAMMARRSELCALRWEDVTETEDGLEIQVRRSKTDQEAVGAV